MEVLSEPKKDGQVCFQGEVIVASVLEGVEARLEPLEKAIWIHRRVLRAGEKHEIASLLQTCLKVVRPMLAGVKSASMLQTALLLTGRATAIQFELDPRALGRLSSTKAR